ncbi:ABC transporter permease [Thermopolyspora flexuosa]|uniref:Peptide/nickel transport system permease protein n=1 Tax=Thermopolyspora flexuosa TaxID=103836 RepID=A0A543ITE6_9ACTN|nr:ABC transporter permease [Thermopolyspora flexuosa]TQM73817.1 peptide/nickel transport system permease protein [Thermopolyspora flexuosa]GGM84330.1 ABC transporter permease [Thermopolyspora flexuosa]
MFLTATPNGRAVRAHLPPRRRRSRRRANAQVVLAAAIIAAVALVSLLAPVVAPYDPDLADGSIKYLGPGEQGHLLGTDEQGRDILSRLIWGGRTSLIVAFLASAAATVIGSLLALVAGLSDDRVAGLSDDRVAGLIMRTVDIMFAFPVIMIALVFAVLLGPGTPVVVLSIVFSAVPYVARVIFAEVKLQRGREYVEAAESLGSGFLAIVFREVLPNVAGQIVVYGTGLVGGMIVFSSSLSALGIGVQPPTADWGRMISEGAKVIITGNVYPALLPGLVVLVVALAFNWLGDGLRDVFDPHTRRADR